MKKLLTTLLVLATVLGIGGATLAAAGDFAPKPWTDLAGHEAEGELTLMAALGIFTGDSGLTGAVKPDDPITRAQFCKVVVTAIGKGSVATGLAGLQPTFSDGASIPTWAWGSVNVASYMGLIAGYADGSFGPNNPVTYAEAVTMLVRAVKGHAAQVPAGVWPYNYLFYAVDEGFTGSVDVGFASLPCTRGDMAKLLFAAMQVNQLDKDGNELKFDPAVEGSENTDILAGRVLEGTFYCFRDLGMDFGVITAESFGPGTEFGLADPVYVVGASSYDELNSQNVLAVLDTPLAEDSKAVFLWRKDGSAVKGVFAEAYYDEDTDQPLLELKDGTKVPSNPFEDLLVTVNGLPVMYGPFTVDYLLPGDDVSINLDKDGNATGVVAVRWDLVNWPQDPETLETVYYHDVISAVEPATEDTPATITFNDPEGPVFAYFDWMSHEYYPLNDLTIEVGETVPVTINGQPAKVEDLRPNDVVKVATMGGLGYFEDIREFFLETIGCESLFAISATRQVVEGDVTATRTTYPGGHVFATVKVGETSKDYEVASDPDYPLYINEPPAKGKHAFLLDESGKLFFDKEYGTGHPIVLITSWTVETAGTDSHRFVTVDELGVEKTYECTDEIDLSDDTGKFAVLSLDGGTGLVGGVSYPAPFWTYEVCAVGTDTVTLRAFFATSISFLDENFVVYDKNTDGSFAYLGLSGLAAGGHEPVVDLYIYSNPLGTWIVLIRVDRALD